MSFSGDLYPTAGATSVMTTKGDMVDYDTARQRLGIGSANQILQVKSNLPSWETVPLADTVLTTAGDILYENATPELARLASGTQYNTLQMGASLPAWSASATSVLTTTGDLLYASAGNTLARLAGGTSGDVLTANGAGVAPSYQTPAGGGGAWASEGNDINTSDGSSLDVTVTDQDCYQVLYNVCDGDAGTCSLTMRLNDVTTSTYSALLSTVTDGGTMGGETQTQTKWLISNAGSALGYQGMLYIYKYDSNFTSNSQAGVTFISQGVKNNSSDVYNQQISAGQNQTITGAVTKVSLLCMKENTEDNRNIRGSMRVNSLSYS